MCMAPEIVNTHGKKNIELINRSLAKRIVFVHFIRNDISSSTSTDSANNAMTTTAAAAIIKPAPYTYIYKKKCSKNGKSNLSPILFHGVCNFNGPRHLVFYNIAYAVAYAVVVVVFFGKNFDPLKLVTDPFVKQCPLLFAIVIQIYAA